MDRKIKKKVMTKYSIHEGDTGSSQVQVAILTTRINELSKHLEEHPKDAHSRRGLLGLVSKRRRHLNYMKLKDKDQYDILLKELKLRK